MNTHTSSKKKNRTILSSLLALGIIACSMVLGGSLFAMCHPFTMEDVRNQAAAAQLYLSQQFTSLTETIASWTDASDSGETTDTPAVSDTEEESIPYIEFTSEAGDISNLQAEYNDPVDQIYLNMLDTSCGPMLYYHQGDIRWGDYLYGGYDPMSKYGCGPTAVSMIINSFSDYPVDPIDIATWASENGYYALHSGSYHSLIPDALEAYGLQVESVTNRSYEHVAELLSSGHILIALMGKGSLTKNGHFVLFTKLLDNGNICIADPANYENCTLEWELDQLLSELKKSYDSGAPLWAVCP